MDQPQYSTLMDALTNVPDPRNAPGKQYPWRLLLTLLCSAVASGQQSGHGIARWVGEHAPTLLTWLQPERGRLPSESTLRRALRQLFFELPAIPADHEQADRVTTISKGHGRIETRTLECSSAGHDYLAWPGIAQIVRRTCERVMVKTGKRSIEVSYGLTNLPACATELEALWRGHSPIENRKHYVRDVTLGEDQGQAYRGNTPHVLAALRNGLIDLMRYHGWSNLADALRHYSASVSRVLALIGALPVGL